ncbi:MAG: plethodontid receptivity factor PRF, partial [Muribaculaceae bacterium]|nr:plethodontid receptivity factor PRF [Muribaculaceae bacterium]
KLREEFEATDNEKSRTLENLKGNLNNVSSAAEIEQAISSLNELTEYFFDDVRRKQAEGLLANYRQLYKGLTLEASKPANGKFTVRLLLQGHPFQAAGVPTLKSNCAQRLQATPIPDGSGYEITYDDIDCLPDEDNWIEVNLRMRDTRIVQKVYI